jgi:uncharacterized membrane protein
MNGYSVARGALDALAFLVKALIVLAYLAMIWILLVSAWKHDHMVSLVCVVMSVIAFFLCLLGIGVLYEWLDRKARSRPAKWDER